MVKRTFSLALGVVLVFGVLPLAQAKLTKSGNPAAVSFTAKGTGGMTIVGKTSDLLLKDDGKILRFTVAFKTLTTGISLRDKHLREKYLQVDKYPTAELAIERKSLQPASGDKFSGVVKGAMKLHGRSKTVEVHYTTQRKGQKIQVTAAAHLNIQDYGILVPSFLGIAVKPEVDIAVVFEVTGS